MKVATFSLEMTSHSSFLTLRALSGTAIWRLSLTLTWQPRRQPSLICLREKKPVEAGLGGEDGAAAVEDLELALAAVGLAAAGGGEEDAVVGEGVHQVAAGSDFQFLGAAVDGDLDGTGRGERGLDPEEKSHENQRDDGHHDDGEKKCICHSAFLRIKGLHP